MQVKPLSDNIVVKGVSKEETTKSGIILPETVDKEKPEQGEVIAVGPGKILDNGQRSPMEVKVGDRVIFKKYSPDEIKVDGEEILVLKQDDVIATLE
ncbi:MAG: co-chaperone GroES [Candidatus Komeilibacteria bacterium CG10_big_fil_rev_8_21_14_0_10_41_13]|uniref:Co-chaperonin GroES n=1 Tax=Candidatus Komeilibacteria bacterium CG10_big_fil_rev_8_21_14_0_10_41_13 TaxID=1974476 RepID=A0A2M6WC43_9BACT|nr:MAG: co-chaperone GroES [Candidatus Komeilibacteria bacterium CG10_big_fil_rev_8_21_14_0_10_41_13]